MSGFTGVNPAQAEVDFVYVTMFFDSGVNILNGAFEFITRDIPIVWASPKAFEFGNKYIPQLNSIMKQFCSLANKFVPATYNAIDALLKANGVSSSSMSYEKYEPIEYANNFKEEIDGVVGMTIENVRNILYSFINRMESFHNVMEFGRGLNIALYDPNGEIKSAFKAMMDHTEEEINGVVDNIKKSLESAIEEEINKVNTAKVASVDILNN